GLSSQLFARYTGSRDEDTGHDLPYFPRWQGGFRWDYVNRAGIRAGLAATYVGRRRDVQFVGDPGRQLGGYTAIELRLRWQQAPRVNYFVQVTDLFDRSPAFYAGFPSAGRIILAGVDFRFSGGR